MPYPNEHSARLRNPEDFKEQPDWASKGQKFARKSDGTIYGKIKVPATADVIWGQLKNQSDKEAAPQSIRFPTKNWTVDKAKKWLKDNNVKYILFEPAEKKKEDSIESNIHTIIAELKSEIWAIEASALNRLIETISHQESFLPQGIVIEQSQPKLNIIGKTAIVPIKGILMKEIPQAFAFWGIKGTSYQTIQNLIKEAVEDPNIDDIVLDVDSPGGIVSGGMETADLIYEAAKAKKMTAVIDDLGASGAYWLLSQAQTIESVPNGEIGSIGVFSIYLDSSKYTEDKGLKYHIVRSGEHKGMGAPGIEITDNQLAATQEIIDGIADNFITSVARGRGIEKSRVQNWASGRLWLAPSAQRMGLIDKVKKMKTKFKEQKMSDQIENENQPNEEQLNQIAKEAAEKAKKENKQRLSELKAAFPDDLEFAIEQFEDGASLVEAKAAYADVLLKKLKEKETEGASAIESGDSSEGESKNFVEAGKKLAKEEKIPLGQAYKKLAKENPELYKSYKASLSL